jgi:hypothetical protein
MGNIVSKQATGSGEQLASSPISTMDVHWNREVKLNLTTDHYLMP